MKPILVIVNKRLQSKSYIARPVWSFSQQQHHQHRNLHVELPVLHARHSPETESRSSQSLVPVETRYPRLPELWIKRHAKNLYFAIMVNTLSYASSIASHLSQKLHLLATAYVKDHSAVTIRTTLLVTDHISHKQSSSPDDFLKPGSSIYVLPVQITHKSTFPINLRLSTKL